MNEKQASMTHFLKCWPEAEYRRDRKVRGSCTCATEMLRGKVSVLRGPTRTRAMGTRHDMGTAGLPVFDDWRQEEQDSESEWNTGALTGHFSMGWLEEEFLGVWGWGGCESSCCSVSKPTLPCCYSAFVSTLEPGFLSNRKHLTMLAIANRVIIFGLIA